MTWTCYRQRANRQITDIYIWWEEHILLWFLHIYLQHCAESWKYALCSLRTTVTNMPPPLLEALRALRAEETETRHQTWLPPGCTGQCTLHCQPGLHLKCVALLTTKRESSSHMPCASWQQARSNGSIVSSRRAFRAWSTASHCSTLQGPRHMIALWVSPTWSLRRFLDLYSWTMKYKNSVLKKTGVTTSLLVVHAVNLKGWTLSGQLGYNHDHAIFNSDFRPGNNPRARLSSIKVIQSVAFEALTIL